MEEAFGQVEGAHRGALTAGVKKDVCLSIKLNKAPQGSQRGSDAVVIYGWHSARTGQRIQGESDIHLNTYVDYSHGIRLVSTEMVVDGEPMSLFEVLEDKELALLLLPPLDVRDHSFPPPRRYPGVEELAPYQAVSDVEEIAHEEQSEGEGEEGEEEGDERGEEEGDEPGEEEGSERDEGSEPAPYEPVEDPEEELARRGRCAYHRARIEIARGVERYGAGRDWATAPNSGDIVDEYQRAALVLIGKNWQIPQSKAHWCGNFCGWNYRGTGFDMDGRMEKAWSVAKQPGSPKLSVFWSVEKLNCYWLNRPGCKRLQFPHEQEDMSREDCIAWLEENFHPFGPQPGDVLLVTTYKPMAHVAMVASYDPETYELVTYEGNYRRRAAAVRWDLSQPGKAGFHRVNVIGRFPLDDFTMDPAVHPDTESPDPEIEEGTYVSGLHDG